MFNEVISIPSKVPQELNQGGTATTEAVFVTGTTTPSGATITSVPIFLPLPSDGKLAAATATVWAANGASGPRSAGRFKVMAGGRATSVSAGNVTVKLYYATSTTSTSAPASAQAIATTGVVSVTGSTNWMIEATLAIDSTSKKLNGYYQSQLAGTTVAPTTITNIQSSVVPDGNSTAQGFVVTGTFGTGVATNALYLDWFVLSIG